MTRFLPAVVVMFLLACGTLINGQDTAATNLAGAPFPLAQYIPNNLTARRITSPTGMTRLQDVEIRTMGIVLRADEADLDTTTGEYQLRGNVRARLVPVKPIWPEARP